jgi:hypothetical protein
LGFERRLLPDAPPGLNANVRRASRLASENPSEFASDATVPGIVNGRFFAPPPPQSPREHAPMEIRPLDHAETVGFDAERKWLDDFLRPFGPEHAMKRTPDDIPTIQSLLDAKPFSSGDPASLEILGAAFGDVVATTLGFSWVVVTDEHGSDFAIKHPSRMILAFPRDMIVKRVESGAEINMTELYHGVIAALEEQIAAQGG